MSEQENQQQHSPLVQLTDQLCKKLDQLIEKHQQVLAENKALHERLESATQQLRLTDEQQMAAEEKVKQLLISVDSALADVKYHQPPVSIDSMQAVQSGG